MRWGSELCSRLLKGLGLLLVRWEGVSGRGCGWPGPMGFFVVPWGWGVTWRYRGSACCLEQQGDKPGGGKWLWPGSWGGDVGNRKNGV